MKKQRAGRPQKNVKHTPDRRPQLYGFHAVREAWLNPDRDVKALYMTAQARGKFKEVPDTAAGRGLIRPAPETVEKKQLDKMLPHGAVHQGIAATVEPLEELAVQDLIIKANTQDKALILMLDQVTDPHNVGAIVRSACAFGASGIIMQRRHAPPLTGVLAKTACGGLEHVDIALETNLSRTLETLKDAGFYVCGLDERGEPLTAGRPADKIVLVMGAEGPGIRRLVKSHCDALLKLPTSGAISSLNVSNAAAIALYALRS